MMKFILLSAFLSVWIGYDAHTRGAQWVWWASGTFVAWIVVVPIYMARRPLMPGETREGGTGWNVLKTFAVLWTGLIAAIFLFSLIPSGTDIPTVGRIFVRGSMLFLVWFVPMLASLMLGFMLRKSQLVETG